MRNLLLLAGVSAAFSGAVSAQVLAGEGFNFTGALTANGWTAHSGAGNKVILANGSVATLNQSAGSGEDVNLAFPVRSATDEVYCAFKLNVPSGNPVNPLTGLYFIHFKDAASGFRGRTGVRAPAGTGDYQIAINADNANLSLGATWPADLAFDTDYTIVFSWNAATGASSLWVDPTASTDPSVTHQGVAVGTLISQIALRQSAEYTGFINVDDVYVGATFNDALAGGTPGGYATYGAGCAGTLGVPSNSASALPRVGQALSIDIGSVAAPELAVLLIGASNTLSAYGPLPLDLVILGAPGCLVQTSDEIQLFGIGASNVVSYPLSIPNDPYFVGVSLYTQGLVFDAANALGLVASDAAAMTIGS